MLYGDYLDFEQGSDSQPLNGSADFEVQRDSASSAMGNIGQPSITRSENPVASLAGMGKILGSMLGGGVFLGGLFLLPFALQRLLSFL